MCPQFGMGPQSLGNARTPTLPSRGGGRSRSRSSPGVPGLRPRGAFFTDTSESESESDLVMSTVAFPISRSESTLESESEPDSTFCRQRAGLGWRVAVGWHCPTPSSAPKPSSAQIPASQVPAGHQGTCEVPPGAPAQGTAPSPLLPLPHSADPDSSPASLRLGVLYLLLPPRCRHPPRSPGHRLLFGGEILEENRNTRKCGTVAPQYQACQVPSSQSGSPNPLTWSLFFSDSEDVSEFSSSVTEGLP